MAGPPDKLARFDRFLADRASPSPWSADGRFAPDRDLLLALLADAVGSAQRTGLIAGAVDVWAAEELRRAGFHPDEVWPRRTQPRVLPRDVRALVEGALTSDLRAQVQSRFASAGARRAMPAEAHVVGRAFRKQSDVLIASWGAGVELLISTKTMLSSYQKNLRNRFEEGYGDAKNLRGRHPLAALGFLFVVGADIPEPGLEFAIDMLRKLSAELDVYDCACLLVLDGVPGGAAGDAEADGDPEAVEPFVLDDGPSLFDPVPAARLGASAAPAAAAPPAAEVRLIADATPPDLAAPAFFERLIRAALERMPLDAYPGVRARMREAAG